MIPEMILVVLLDIIPMIKRTINHSYDSGDNFNIPFGIIAMINSTINHSYHSQDDINSPIDIILNYDL